MRTSCRFEEPTPQPFGRPGKCTHQKCEVGYNGAQGRIDCKCHGSEFDMKGKVLNGPATKNLPRYACGLKDDKVIIKTG